MRPAVFLDRDGTLIEWVHHLVDPEAVRVIAGAPAAIRALQAAGYACVVVTNLSVVARGLLTEAGLAAIHAVMNASLAADSAQLDGLYYCPAAPSSSDPDRKPAPGMLQRAQRDLDLDLGRSFVVGDSLSDLRAGRNAGCRAGILVRTGVGHAVDARDAAVDHVAADVAAAARWILALDATPPAAGGHST